MLHPSFIRRCEDAGGEPELSRRAVGTMQIGALEEDCHQVVGRLTEDTLEP